MSKPVYKFIFHYDDRGYGELTLYKDEEFVISYYSRTGSIKRQGVLVNAIEPGDWTMRAVPVDTTEKGMWIKKGNGWKVRLFTPAGNYSHFLVHPDGNRPGTKGCIGIQSTDALRLKGRIENIMEEQSVIVVEIRKQNEKIIILKEEPLKKWWQSKTLWANLITIGGLAAEKGSGVELVSPDVAAMILAGVNIILRLITSKPISR